ncbi:hypothetical protein YSY43_22000 [Paenibacillus sp. YSY-4.3]
MISRYEVSSLKKGLQVLNLLRAKHALTLTEIAEELDMNKTTIFRLLHTLEEMNYVLKVDKYYRGQTGIFAFDSVPVAAVDVEWSKLQILYKLFMYIHYPDQNTDKAEAIGALKQLKDEGKIRAVGVSNFSLEQPLFRIFRSHQAY